MNLNIVKCNVNDLEALTHISKETFITAFQNKNNPDDFEAHLSIALTRHTIKNELQNPNSDFYFVYLNTECVGYCKTNVKEAQTELFDLNAFELERLYVLENHQGKHIGQYVLEYCIHKAQASHANYIWLGVWEKNTNAIRFYERMGFEKFGSHPFYIGNDKQTDWLMKLNLV
tara:strand:+ start:5929 stop:6447 length:519 start_codon:yes stop_codon:yes gene_type:complete